MKHQRLRDIAGSTDAALTAAGSAGDPWATPLPRRVWAGTAGNILGSNLDICRFQPLGL
ncbi:MAG: hypothetical protein H6661_10050 [Ardenticatenaceae bacterium]|nr:hypothetical protein [Ardenticatenaceae bacterium]